MADSTVHITLSDEQKSRLKAILRMYDEAKARDTTRSIWDYLDIVAPLKNEDKKEEQ